MAGRGKPMMILRISIGVSIAVLAASATSAQGLITEHRLSAGLANEAVAEAVASCAKSGYDMVVTPRDLYSLAEVIN